MDAITLSVLVFIAALIGSSIGSLIAYWIIVKFFDLVSMALGLFFI